jgi:hypothetical protein
VSEKRSNKRKNQIFFGEQQTAGRFKDRSAV